MREAESGVAGLFVRGGCLFGYRSAKCLIQNGTGGLQSRVRRFDSGLRLQFKALIRQGFFLSGATLHGARNPPKPARNGLMPPIQGSTATRKRLVLGVYAG